MNNFQQYNRFIAQLVLFLWNAPIDPPVNYCQAATRFKSGSIVNQVTDDDRSEERSRR